MKASKIVMGLLGATVLLVGGGWAWVEATAKLAHPEAPLPAIVAVDDPEVIARGAYLVHAVAHCSACHGAPADEGAPMVGGHTIEAGPFGTFHASNLTPDQTTGIGRYTDGELARAIRHGVHPDGRLAAMMRLAVGPMSDDDLRAIVSYLRAQKPVVNEVPPSVIGVLGKLVSVGLGPRPEPPPEHVPAGGVSVARGKYLAEGPAMCVGCHSVVDPMNGFRVDGEPFAGSEPEPDPTSEAHEITAPNLTTGGYLAGVSEDEFVARLKAGRADAMRGSKMPWEAFQRLTEEDIRSIHRYLLTVPPSSRDPGPSRRER